MNEEIGKIINFIEFRMKKEKGEKEKVNEFVEGYVRKIGEFTSIWNNSTYKEEIYKNKKGSRITIMKEIYSNPNTKEPYFNRYGFSLEKFKDNNMTKREYMLIIEASTKNNRRIVEGSYILYLWEGEGIDEILLEQYKNSIEEDIKSNLGISHDKTIISYIKKGDEILRGKLKGSYSILTMYYSSCEPNIDLKTYFYDVVLPLYNNHIKEWYSILPVIKIHNVSNDVPDTVLKRENNIKYNRKDNKVIILPQQQNSQ